MTVLPPPDFAIKRALASAREEPEEGGISCRAAASRSTKGELIETLKSCEIRRNPLPVPPSRDTLSPRGEGQAVTFPIAFGVGVPRQGTSTGSGSAAFASASRSPAGSLLL